MKFGMYIEVDDWCMMVCRMTRFKVKVNVISNWKPLKRSRPSVPHGAKFFWVYWPPDMSWAGHFPPPSKLPLRFAYEDLDPHLIDGSLGPPRVYVPNVITIGFSSFCRAHNCDRPKDIPDYSVCNSRPHLRSAVMQPNSSYCYYA